jgi:hypothetical protein
MKMIGQVLSNEETQDENSSEWKVTFSSYNEIRVLSSHDVSLISENTKCTMGKCIISNFEKCFFGILNCFFF